METQKISKAPWWATANLVIGVFSFLSILMLFAIMSTDFYKIFYVIFGEKIGELVIRGMYIFGMYLAFPIGIINFFAGIVSIKQGHRNDNKGLSRIAVASIVFGVLGILLGGGLFVFAVFFLTF